MFTGVKRYWLVAAVVMSLVGGGLSWPSAAHACTVTTTVSKPTNVTATVNEEILLQWGTPLESDNVFSYDVFRGVGPGATPKRYGNIDVETVYDVSSDTDIPTGSLTSTVDYEYRLVAGKTYVYAVAFGRYDNCYGFQRGELSDRVTVLYQPMQ